MMFARQVIWKRVGAVSLLAVSLAACTVGHTPAPVLPSKDTIVAGETAVVEKNQNIYAFARAHNASMREIIVLNNMQPPFIIKPGQTLILPAGAGGTVVPAGDIKGQAPAPSSAPQGAIEAVELPPPAAVSAQSPPPGQPADQKHDNTIAAAPVAAAAVEALNAPSAPPPPVATTVKAPPQQQAMATGNPEPLTPPAPVPPPPVLPETAAKPAVAPASVSMIWPLQGPILSSFGDKGAGLTNDGINIGAPKGAPVVAAASGTVVYVGNEMKGFGNLVLIRHENGWITAYAHLGRTLVSKDSVVAQGDMIGTVGKTGNVPSPQLHFETRHDGKPVDPRTLIKG